LTSDGLFSGVFARGDAAAAVTDAAWLQAMLDFEAALARACARAELIPAESAEAIATACRGTGFDTAALGQAAAATGNPVVPLLDAIRALLEPAAAEHLHRGATSQDVIDTAAMLVAKRALAPVLDDAAMTAACLAELAETHRGTVMIGRTLMQQALPTTFGLKAAVWLAGLDLARRRLAQTADECLAVQYGGAVGTLDALGDRGPAVVAGIARELDLAEPPLPWHADRVRVVAVADAAAVLAGAFGKPARDVILLAQDEVGEVREGGPDARGGSSAMAHKRNPVAAIAAVACAQRIPGLLATLHAAMLGEHERAAGAWHSEWETLSDLLRLTGSAAAWGREMLHGLEVDGERMALNLAAAAERIPAAARPEASLGSASVFIDRALAAHRGQR
jgi:3-carboxy-cis,cis-muconate cycloisomerase